jgi:dGTPase
MKASKRGVTLVKGGDKARGYTVRCLIDMMVENAIINSEKRINDVDLSNPEQAQFYEENIICFDPEFYRMTQQLREFLYKNVYHHPDVSAVNEKAVNKMKKLYAAYIENPSLMRRTANKRIKKDGLHLAVADYIAGMTDRFALREYDKLF